MMGARHNSSKTLMIFFWDWKFVKSLEKSLGDNALNIFVCLEYYVKYNILYLIIPREGYFWNVTGERWCKFKQENHIPVKWTWLKSMRLVIEMPPRPHTHTHKRHVYSDNGNVENQQVSRIKHETWQVWNQSKTTLKIWAPTAEVMEPAQQQNECYILHISFKAFHQKEYFRM